ncbi:MAG: hypothetical protein PHD67_02580 [Oscillospiraceae bacterium]|nr:hypothetical protein [Oscillospiraceae bacterium]
MDRKEELLTEVIRCVERLDYRDLQKLSDYITQLESKDPHPGGREVKRSDDS